MVTGTVATEIRRPRARGGEPDKSTEKIDGIVVVPAHAGVNRSPRHVGVALRSRPRARGGEPVIAVENTAPFVVVPAHAGVNRLKDLEGQYLWQSSPRTRG